MSTLGEVVYVLHLKFPWLDLPKLLLECCLAGWVLSAYSASMSIWILIEIIVLYIAWVGTGAIALATVAVLGIVWIATLFTPCPEGMLSIVSLTAAQGWALSLGLSWLLATALVFKLGFTTQRWNIAGCGKVQTFWLLVLVTNLGLRVGQLIEIKLS